MKTATLVRDNLENWRGHAALYRLSEPVEYSHYGEDENDPPTQERTEYVVAASITTWGGTAETSVFPVESEDAQFMSGVLDLACIEKAATHAEVLGLIGYSIV